MATKNGEKYLSQQLDSILTQLSDTDELIITDDTSIDRTTEIIRGYKDPRVSLQINQEASGIPLTFEKSLIRAKGRFIFLADQDDVWLPHKVRTMLCFLDHYDLVVSDCALADHHLTTESDSFFKINKSGKGLIRNIIRNSYMGCCMAFRRPVLEKAIPFPPDIPMHDGWIGLVAERYFKVKFVSDVLVQHRRHDRNASTNGDESSFSLREKLMNRYRLLKSLFFYSKRYAVENYSVDRHLQK